MGPTQTWHLGNVRKHQDSILAPLKGKHLDGTVHNHCWSLLSHLPFSLLHSNVVYAWVMSPHQVSLRSLKPSHCPSHWILFSPHPILYSFSTYCGWLAPASWKVLLLWFWSTWLNISPVPFFLFQVNFYWMTVLCLESIQKVEVIICPFLNHFYSTEHCPRVFNFVKLYRKTFKTVAIKSNIYDFKW